MMAVAFVLCNMDKVNMSVAVIPMARDLGWSATDRGLVSSSFFWGYSLTQVPAGWISTRIGGAKVLMAGVALWSFGTLIAPPAAHLGLWALCASRVLVGLGEGFAPSAATSVLARQVPSTERSRAVTTVWGGLDVGSAVGLLLSGPLIRLYGWPSVFYLFAVLGGVWCLFWPMFQPELEDPAVKLEQLATRPNGRVRVPRAPVGADAGSSAGAAEAIMDARNVADSVDEFLDENLRSSPYSRQAETRSSSQQQPGISQQQQQQQKLQRQQQEAQRRETEQREKKAGPEAVPWGAFMTSAPVWAVTVAHFCFNWGYYTLLAWLPSYFELALGLNVQESSFLTLIPYVAMVAMTPVVGPVADGLIKRGWDLTSVRKLAQGLAFVGPAVCMVACAALTPAAPLAVGSAQTALLVGLLSLGFALGAWSRAGLYCNHQDLSPKYASALLGITNTAGALPGVLGVTSAGYLLDATGSWALALFFPTAACQLFGAVFYSIFASSERQPWS
ncbi:putative anion transporter 6 [Monoraphidium neglectum]|uniref:Putative anion transporter 6 n=1 Tax=Monoraphidium neglectum TaxID=145388 RepID=A0A0D2LDF6_9CHLO|nr:putative anion transporter 6 [Monoraphidium neglectum]KIZ04724.1 putative anion transporter 6 [Monoraphidium neglectum]|eukprot:XP_013903743.1 putative anion transporter 6 [Monoraphidium neglectum]